VCSLAAGPCGVLAGEPPFTAPWAQAMIARRLTESPRPLTQLRDTIAGPLAQAVSKALAKQPADRYSTAAEFARALETTSSTRVPAPAVTTSPAAATSAGASPVPTVRLPSEATSPVRRRVPLTFALG